MADRRFESTFFTEPTDDPGLVLGPDGVVYLVKPDGSRVAVGSGGSQPLLKVSIPFTFDTPGLLAGIPVYTPAVGDVIFSASGPGVGSYLSVTTVFNGTTPNAYLFRQGEDPTDAPLGNAGAFAADPDFDGHFTNIANVDFLNRETFVAVDPSPLLLSVNDASNGDPGSTQGAGVLVLVVLLA